MHHTKGKADIGLAKVIADLTSKGHTPCIPLSEHQPYDLIVALREGTTIKVQVKYASLKKNGIVDVKYRRSWADKNGNHMKLYKKTDFDYYAIYCPERERVLYVPNTSGFPKTIRFEKPSNNQKKYIHWAETYADIVKKA